MAFQHLAERLFILDPSVKAPGQNVFQRLGQGSQLWRDSIGAGYEDWLTPGELDELKLFFQRRHLLAHRDGLVDEKYVQNSGDRGYRVGQRLVVARADVIRMVSLVDKLGLALRGAVESVVRPASA